VYSIASQDEMIIHLDDMGIIDTLVQRALANKHKSFVVDSIRKAVDRTKLSRGLIQFEDLLTNDRNVEDAFSIIIDYYKRQTFTSLDSIKKMFTAILNFAKNHTKKPITKSVIFSYLCAAIQLGASDTYVNKILNLNKALSPILEVSNTQHYALSNVLNVKVLDKVTDGKQLYNILKQLYKVEWASCVSFMQYNELIPLEARKEILIQLIQDKVSFSGKCESFLLSDIFYLDGRQNFHVPQIVSTETILASIKTITQHEFVEV